MRDFRDKVAVVTGAASGIGRALAERFGSEGMKVVLADVEAAALAATTEALRGRGVDALAVVTDVSEADSVAALARRTLDTFGAVHVVCNNAGVLATGACWETPVEDYEWVFGVNIWGVIHGVRTFVPILLEQNTEAHIVNTASMAAVTGGALTGSYYMSKHAVLSLSESLYHELAIRGAPIGVSALCPEVISTGIGTSGRNRPAHLGSGTARTADAETVEQALRDYIARGTPPAVIADRVVQAIRDNRFYILSDDGWRRSCETRLEDIRLARNPTLSVPGSNA